MNQFTQIMQEAEQLTDSVSSPAMPLATGVFGQVLAEAIEAKALAEQAETEERGEHDPR